MRQAQLILIWDNLAGHLSTSMVIWLFAHGVMPLYTPLSGSWLNMAESVQRIVCGRALNGQHPQTAAEIITWLEDTVAGWNAAPTPSPAEARKRGISTVYQDLALAPLMPIWRNFFLGAEPTKGWGPFSRIDVVTGKRTALEELAKMGINLRDPEQPVSVLSGGQRQSVATARAVYFGARLLILDEPTAALGVKQAGIVLRHIGKARERGLGVVFITHNPAHAYLVGDRFVLLNHGRCVGDYRKSDVTRNELIHQMSAGAELDQLQHELDSTSAEFTPLADEAITTSG